MLEDILKPFKVLDEDILRQYTKISNKYHLDEGKRKYWVGFALNTTSIFLTGPPATALGGDIFDFGSWAITGLIDGMYNMNGIIKRVKDDNISDTKVIDKPTNFYKRYNATIRLPVLLAGVGMVGKSGIDLYNNIANSVPIDLDSSYYFECGLGLITLSSSMYLKDTDPKLLQKDPLWKEIYNSAKENISLLVPQPNPQPIPFTNYQTK